MPFCFMPGFPDSLGFLFVFSILFLQEYFLRSFAFQEVLEMLVLAPSYGNL